MIPAHNAEAYLVRAVESVLAQSFADHEVVVVDDGSTDATARIASELAAKDDRVRVVHHEKNKGLSAARNTALEAARGEYLSMLDADDIMLPTQLEVLLGALRESNCGLVFASYELFDDTGVIEKDHVDEVDRIRFGASTGTALRVLEPFAALLPGNFISNSCVLVQTERARDIEGWDTSLKVGADRVFYLRLSRHVEFACVRDVLARKENRDDRLSAPGLGDALRRVQVSLIGRDLCETDAERQIAAGVLVEAARNATYQASLHGVSAYRDARKQLKRSNVQAPTSLRDFGRAVYHSLRGSG